MPKNDMFELHVSTILPFAFADSVDYLRDEHALIETTLEHHIAIIPHAHGLSLNEIPCEKPELDDRASVIC